MLTVWFNGTSSEEFELTVVNIGRRQKASEIVDEYAIPYRNGDLTIHTNTYKPYIRTIEFALNNKSFLANIYRWLNGSGHLNIVNFREEQHSEGYVTDGYYNATVIDISTAKLSTNFDSIIVTFKCQPFYRLFIGDKLLSFTTNNVEIPRIGTIDSQPYIKIIGNGNIDLFINEKVHSFKDIDGYIEVDSELMIVYKDTINQGRKMSGDFPTLKSSNTSYIKDNKNYIYWTGDVTELQIKPRWREL